jgi:hypothetical protein
MSGVVHRGRFSAEIEGDFVVFLIGMRVNRPWKPHKWLPVLVAMSRMLRRLGRDPDARLLAWTLAWINGPAVVQYWRSFEALDGYARAGDDLHLPSWKWFNRAVGASGDVGVWHETYKVRAGEYEGIYVNMPGVGLATAGAHAPVGSARQTAARRIGVVETDEPAVAPYDNP